MAIDIWAQLLLIVTRKKIVTRRKKLLRRIYSHDREKGQG
jgi:hypothetical protein